MNLISFKFYSTKIESSEAFLSYCQCFSSFCKFWLTTFIFLQSQALSLTKSPTRPTSPSRSETERSERPLSRPHSATRPSPMVDSTNSLLNSKKEIFDLSKTASGIYFQNASTVSLSPIVSQPRQLRWQISSGWSNLLSRLNLCSSHAPCIKHVSK